MVDHGRKVEECVARLSSLLSVVLKGGREEEIRRLATEVSELETEADQVRDRIHEALSGKLMLPVSRGDLFDRVEQRRRSHMPAPRDILSERLATPLRMETCQ